MRKFLFNNPMLLLFLALVALSGCSKSKSGKDRSNNDQKAFRDSHFNVSKIPNQATWTAEESRCVDRARAESRPLEMCFANLNNSENINGRPSNTNGWPTNQEEKINGPFTKTDSSTCAHGETPAQHRDHQGKNCNDESDVAGTVVSTDTPSGYHVHSAPAPQSYPAPVYQPPAQLQVQPQPRPQPRPQQPAAPAPRVAPPQYDYPPVASAPQPRPQPQPQRAPVVTAPPVPTTPAQEVTCEQRSLGGPAVIPNPNRVANAPKMVIERTPPAQAHKVGNTGANQLYVVYESLSDSQVINNRDLSQAANSAFSSQLPRFNTNNENRVKEIVDDISYYNNANSTAAQSVISNRLAFDLHAPFRRDACDVHKSGPCLIMEKKTTLTTQSKCPESTYEVYFLGADYSNVKENAKSAKENRIIYYRMDLPTEQSYVARALADPLTKDGFYLFSRLQLIQQPVPPVVVPPTTPPTSVLPPTSTLPPIQPSQNVDVAPHLGSGVGASESAGAANTATNSAAAPLCIPDNPTKSTECTRQQIEYEANAAIEQSINRCKENREKDLRIKTDTYPHGGNLPNRSGLAKQKPNEAFINAGSENCDDPRRMTAHLDGMLKNERGHSGIFWLCAMKARFESNNRFLGFVFGQINYGAGNIYCKPSDGGPTQKIPIALEEHQGASFGIELGKSDYTMVATGIGWSPGGAVGVVGIQEYPYLIQASTSLSIFGGVGLTPLAFGSNRAAGLGPILAFAASGTNPDITKIFRVKLRINLMGKVVLGPQG